MSDTEETEKECCSGCGTTDRPIIRVVKDNLCYQCVVIIGAVLLQMTIIHFKELFGKKDKA